MTLKTYFRFGPVFRVVRFFLTKIKISFLFVSGSTTSSEGHQAHTLQSFYAIDFISSFSFFFFSLITGLGDLNFVYFHYNKKKMCQTIELKGCWHSKFKLNQLQCKFQKRQALWQVSQKETFKIGKITHAFIVWYLLFWLFKFYFCHFSYSY